MTKYTEEDRQRIVDLLCEAFNDNLSVNYVLKKDGNQTNRLRNLMEYSVSLGELFGKIYLTKNKDACAVLIYPEKKKVTLKSIWLDIKVVFGAIGVTRVFKVLRRQSEIQKKRPDYPVTHLWYIAVASDTQGKGLGGELLQQILTESERPVHLETSTIRNFSFYEKHGFKLQEEFTELGYPLRLYEHENEKEFHAPHLQP